MSESREASTRSIAVYKTILRRVLDNRPSGTRLKLAAALGTNRSFISQITNPGYPIPIPVQHLEIICEVCHLAPAERAEFLDAYNMAHPGRAASHGQHSRARSLTLSLPDLGDDRRNQAMERAIHDFAARLVLYTKELDPRPKTSDAVTDNDTNSDQG